MAVLAFVENGEVVYVGYTDCCGRRGGHGPLGEAGGDDLCGFWRMKRGKGLPNEDTF